MIPGMTTVATSTALRYSARHIIGSPPNFQHACGPLGVQRGLGNQSHHNQPGDMIKFETLEVWKRGHQLTLRVYDITSGFPNDEMYGLTAQLRRAAASIPLNIAEGCGRGISPTDLAHFVRMARGSASECVAAVRLALDLSYLTKDQARGLVQEIEEVRRMLFSFIRTIRRKDWY